MNEQQQTEVPTAQQRELEQDLFERAKRITTNDEKTAESNTPKKMGKVMDSSSKNLPFVRDMIAKIRLLYAMMRDKNFNLQWKNKTLVIAGLLYFISPIDLIPDFIPLVGYIDDAFVISLVLNSLAAEIERYQALYESNV